MNKDCGIVRDLLPLVIDDVAGSESKEFVETHLTGTTSYFMGRELYFILMIAIALYFLFTLAWQVWLQRRKER